MPACYVVAVLTHHAQARCINRYGIASITTSASFEFAHNFAQEESQGQPICIYMEDDDDAMVLDLDSSSASVAGACCVLIRALQIKD